MDDFMDYDSKLDHYIEIGAISIEGVDPDGELILSVTDKARELAPDLWQAHIEDKDPFD